MKKYNYELYTELYNYAVSGKWKDKLEERWDYDIEANPTKDYYFVTHSRCKDKEILEVNQVPQATKRWVDQTYLLWNTTGNDIPFEAIALKDITINDYKKAGNSVFAGGVLTDNINKGIEILAIVLKEKIEEYKLKIERLDKLVQEIDEAKEEIKPFEELNQEELLKVLQAYDMYIQNANDNNLYKEGWYPVCIAEYYMNDYRERDEE